MLAFERVLMARTMKIISRKMPEDFVCFNGERFLASIDDVEEIFL